MTDVAQRETETEAKGFWSHSVNEKGDRERSGGRLIYINVRRARPASNFAC